MATSAFLFSLSTLDGYSQNTEDPLVNRVRADAMLTEQGTSGSEPQAGETLTGFGVPYSRVIRDVEPPYEDIFRNFKLRGEIDTKMGEAAADFHADFFRGVRLSTPFSMGVRPETAEFKLGNFYLDAQALSASLLFTDNVDQTESNRRSDVLMEVRLNLAAMYHFGDTFRVTLRGAFIYLPLSNEIGVAGFGVDDVFGQFGYQPLAEARVAYNLHLGHWELELIDDFVIRQRRFADGVDFEIFEGATFESQDSVGRFRLNSSRTIRSNARANRQQSINLIEARNQAGAIVTRMLPTETRFEVGAFHENRFYFNKGNHQLPNSRDYVFANLINEREEMRFKPFLHYEASKYDNRPNWSQKIMAGIQGPLTDQLHFRGEIGEYQSTFGQTRLLSRVRLEHNPTPLFYYYLQFSRTITDPDEDLAEESLFRARHKINDHLRAELTVIKSHFEDLNQNLSGSDEWRVGVRFTYDLGRGSTIQIGEVYSQIDNEDSSEGDLEIWTTEVRLRYRHSETLESHLTYRFQIFDSNLPSDSFYENLVLYTLTKYF